jgi:hypothetical protein
MTNIPFKDDSSFVKDSGIVVGRKFDNTMVLPHVNLMSPHIAPYRH